MLRILRVGSGILVRRRPFRPVACNACARALGRLTMDWYEWHRGYDKSDGSQAASRNSAAAHRRRARSRADRAISSPQYLRRRRARPHRRCPRPSPARRRDLHVGGAGSPSRGSGSCSGRGCESERSGSLRLRRRNAEGCYEGRIPCQLALACGVIGNLAPDTTPAFIRLASAVCDTGGSLIWTRLLSANNGASHTPVVRRLLAEAGFEEVRADVVDADDGNPEHLRNEFGAGRFLVASHVHRVGPAELPRGELFKFVGFKALLKESMNR